MSLSPIIEIPTPAIILADMQLNGAPPEAGRPKAALKAIELIVSGAKEYLQQLEPQVQRDLLMIVDKVSKRVLLKKNLQALIKDNFDVTQKTIEPKVHSKLLEFGAELAKIIENRAPKLLELGFKPEQIGNALVKMNFDQIEQCFVNQHFLVAGKIEASRVDSILNARDALELYQRFAKTYQQPELGPLAVHQRIVLVRSSELANERIAVAKDILSAGFESSIALDYALANQEERAWFNRKIQEPIFFTSPSALIRLAKTEPEQREKDLQKIVNFILHGATATDAIGIVLRKDLKENSERALMVFEIALDAGLNSTAALDFALSKKGQQSPNSRVGSINTLKALPLGFSDEHIVALVTGGQKRYQPNSVKDNSTKTEAEKFKDHLTKMVLNKFMIDRKDPEAYQTRRLFAKLDVVEMIDLYKVFFNSQELPDLIKKAHHQNGLYSYIDDLLINQAALDQQNFQKLCRQYKQLINQPEQFTSKKFSPEFQELNQALSDFLISIDPDIRYRAKLTFNTWLVAVVKKYYTKALDLSPEVVESIIDWTINHYDPIKQQLNGKKPVNILKSFGAAMQHFYHHLIEHKLSENPKALRAYVVFSRAKTKEKTSEEPIADQKIWETLRKQQPGNEVAINFAEAIYNEVKALYKK